MDGDTEERPPPIPDPLLNLLKPVHQGPTKNTVAAHHVLPVVPALNLPAVKAEPFQLDPVADVLQVEPTLLFDHIPPSGTMKEDPTEAFDVVDEFAKTEAEAAAPPNVAKRDPVSEDRQEGPPSFSDAFSRIVPESATPVRVHEYIAGNMDMSSSRTSSTAATSTVESKKSFTVPDEYLEMYKKVTCEVCPEPKSFESIPMLVFGRGSHM